MIFSTLVELGLLIGKFQTADREISILGLEVEFNVRSITIPGRKLNMSCCAIVFNVTAGR
jgi:hypothetical protein